MFTLSPLPYKASDLEPHICAETLEIHHGKHHQGYVDKLNEAIEKSSEDVGEDLLDIIRNSEGHLYNMAAQVWNHAFYWQCLSPAGGGIPTQPVTEALEGAFGSVDNFREEFTRAALGEFGSGWAWLVRCEDGSLSVRSTTDAVNPASEGQTPLLVLDVWEHAYYLDYRNRRAEYVEAFFAHLVNWNTLEKALDGTAAPVQ